MAKLDANKDRSQAATPEHVHPTSTKNLLSVATRPEHYQTVKTYNQKRLGTLSFAASEFVRVTGMRRGHLKKMPADEWDRYVLWCAGFEKLMRVYP